MKKIISCLLILLLLGGCKQEKKVIVERPLNVIDYSEAKELNLDLYSTRYLLIRLNDFKVLYARNSDEKMYPASLTKVITMNNALRFCNDVNDTSLITYEDKAYLYVENASVAGLYPEVEYTMKDLLYALILPSGADAAIAIEHYLENKNISIVDEMNNRASELGLITSNFTNTTGLHDDNHFTSLDDLLIYAIDTLQYKEGREVLETIKYTMADGTELTSTIYPVVDEVVEVLGGKTGYTSFAGRCIMVFYRFKNRSYLLMLAGAEDLAFEGSTRHYEDVRKIFKELYYYSYE